jgi:hypothetical protein
VRRRVRLSLSTESGFGDTPTRPTPHSRTALASTVMVRTPTRAKACSRAMGEAIVASRCDLDRVAEFLLRPHFTFSQRGRALRPRRPPHRATAMRLPHSFAACAALLLGCAALCGGAVGDGALRPNVRAGTATPAPIRAQPAGVADAVIGAWWTRNTPGLHHSREESARGLRRFLVSAATSLPLARTLLLTDEDVSLRSPR